MDRKNRPSLKISCGLRALTMRAPFNKLRNRGATRAHAGGSRRSAHARKAHFSDVVLSRDFHISGADIREQVQVLVAVEVRDIQTEIKGFFHLGGEFRQDLVFRNLAGDEAGDDLARTSGEKFAAGCESGNFRGRKDGADLRQGEMESDTEAVPFNCDTSGFVGEGSAGEKGGGAEDAAVEGFGDAKIHAMGKAKVIRVGDEQDRFAQSCSPGRL